MALILGLIGLTVLVAVMRWHRKLSAALDSRDELRLPRKQHPSITVIQPVRGKDGGAPVPAILGDAYRLLPRCAVRTRQKRAQASRELARPRVQLVLGAVLADKAASIPSTPLVAGVSRAA